MPAKGQKSGYIVLCENCGKEVYKTKTQYNKSKHHYCGNKCQKEFLHKQTYEDRKCEICGDLFHTRIKSDQRFCSDKCQNIWQTKQTGINNIRFTRIKIKCEYCGNEYYVKKYKEFSQHNFCSQECRKKWYAEIFSQSDSWKEESRKRAVKILENKQLGTNTKPQQIVNNILDDLNVLYVNEKGFKYYAVDNYLVNNDLIIEVMGDFWHCNPKKYSSGNNYDVHKKRIPRDKAKHTYFKKYYDIEILYIWEDDIYNNLDVCVMLIKKYIEQNGVLQNYHSFNYHIENGCLVLNDNIITPYQDVVNA